MPARKVTKSSVPKRVPLSAKPSGFSKPAALQPTAIPPARAHSASYHYPLLLDEGDTSAALLNWFEGIEDARSMPWRKKWIDPSSFEGKEDELDEVLATRAYEVWVSEVMLQQTRVSTVIPYFNAWISKWPTVQDLAKADHDEVLSVWKGLGYYSRATRLHQGAQAMVSQNRSGCLIPSNITELQNFPGIGRYTAGAISSIAFGLPEPVLDGNVARVLSRQLGLYSDVKDKKTSDVLWEVADQLIKNVSEHPEVERSAVPSSWNQAMMELGSTICTPRPKCDECPIRKTCRAYSEGQALSAKKQEPTPLPDIEDACLLCEQLDTEDLVTAPAEENEDNIPERPSKKRKVQLKNTNTISRYFGLKTPSAQPTANDENEEFANVDKLPANESKKRKALVAAATPKSTTAYCSLFPKKIPKKKVAEEECVVCMIELRIKGGHSKWLIEQRPAKGLLASLWQFPQSTLAASKSTTASRKTSAQQFISTLDTGEDVNLGCAAYVGELDSLIHIFSHLKLTMHVQLFRVDANKAADAVPDTISGYPARRWISTGAMDNETLSTGMRRCWELLSKDG